MTESMRRKYAQHLVRALIIPLAVAAVGCQQYNWRYDMERAEADAKQQNKELFIFYKYYLDNDSNRMLGSEVLSDPEIVALFQDTVNVLIDKAFGPQYEAYVARFGVGSYPASILVAPDGRYEVLKGFVPKQRFIDFVRTFRQTHRQRSASSAGR